MNITLHQATEEVRAMLEQIDPDTGELPVGFEHAREVVATKSLAVAAWILETDRQAGYLKGYAQELIHRADAAKRRSEWLRTYLREHMAAAGITKIKDDRGLIDASLSVGRDKSVEIFDAAQLPADYMREIPAKFEPDKTLIRKAIDDGFEVPGARVVSRDRLTIR